MAELMKLLRAIEARLIRVESRIVQLMNHMGTSPKGALKRDKRGIVKDEHDPK